MQQLTRNIAIHGSACFAVCGVPGFCQDDRHQTDYFAGERAFTVRVERLCWMVTNTSDQEQKGIPYPFPRQVGRLEVAQELQLRRWVVEVIDGGDLV